MRVSPSQSPSLDPDADAHSPKVITWEALDHAGAQDIVSKIFDSDGGEDVRQWLGDSGEVRRKLLQSSPSDPLAQLAYHASSLHLTAPRYDGARVVAGEAQR